MTPVRLAFLDAANSAADLLADPAVAASWGEPSALTGFSVGGLAVHLASQVLNVEGALHREAPALENVALLEHYARSPWVEAAVDHEANLSIVAGGETAAVEGPATLAARVADAVVRLRDELPLEPEDRLVNMAWWTWTLSLDDMLVTRMMEIAVHSDDLAVSVGVRPPELPAQVLEPVLDLLAQLSLRRHGATALLRTYARSERAPATVSAF
jgi:Mycothiol maleylpyruvate isomerase N-terminal domain